MKTKDPIVPPFHFIGCLILGVVLALLLVDFAEGQSLSIKNPCSKWVYGDPEGWPCYNKTQGLSDGDKLAEFAALKARIKKLKLKKPRKVINNIRAYITHLLSVL